MTNENDDEREKKKDRNHPSRVVSWFAIVFFSILLAIALINVKIWHDRTLDTILETACILFVILELITMFMLVFINKNYHGYGEKE